MNTEQIPLLQEGKERKEGSEKERDPLSLKVCISHLLPIMLLILMFR